MMTISISKGRLEKIASWREKYGPDESVVIPAAEAEEMARFILALQEQEPAATLYNSGGRASVCMIGQDLADGYVDVFAAPVTPSAPELTPIYQYQSGIYNEDNGETDWYWDDCDIGFYSQYAEDRRRVLYASPVPPAATQPTVTAEHRRVIEMLLKVCGCAFELMDDGCQQEIEGDPSLVVPYESAQALSDVLDEIENSLPTEDEERPDVYLAWSAMPRAALKSLLQLSGNAEQAPAEPASKPDALPGGNHSGDDTEKDRYTVIPEGWALVPKEPTPEMCEAGYKTSSLWCFMQCDNSKELHYSFSYPRYKAMLEAAPNPTI